MHSWLKESQKQSNPPNDLSEIIILYGVYGNHVWYGFSCMEGMDLQLM